MDYENGCIWICIFGSGMVPPPNRFLIFYVRFSKGFEMLKKFQKNNALYLMPEFSKVGSAAQMEAAGFMLGGRDM